MDKDCTTLVQWICIKQIHGKQMDKLNLLKMVMDTNILKMVMGINIYQWCLLVEFRVNV